MDSRIETWRDWITSRIRPHVYEMHLHRFVFDEIGKIMECAELPASYIFEYLPSTYGTSQSMAVRKQADKDQRTASLVNLLTEIAAAPDALTWEFFLGEWGDDLPELVRKSFERFAEPGCGQIAASRVLNDITQLETTAEIVKRYVDQYVAHDDAKPTAKIATFDEVNAGIDVIGRLYARYYSLLYPGESYGSLVPIIDHDWKAVFRVPWIRSATSRGDNA